ncbi:hypothetical protein YH62_25320 [Rhizobium sp. LC145]|nr:hypothetical protein YH62_25320 [Rhizobium sp. LC145]
MAGRFDQHVRQSVPIAVITHAARQGEHISRAVLIENLLLGKGPVPSDAIRNTQLFSQRLEISQFASAAYVLEPPMDVGGQNRQRLQKHIEPFFVDGTSDTQYDHRIGGISSVAQGASTFKWRKPIQVKAVITQMDVASIARQIAKMFETGSGTGDRPLAVGKLVAQLPFRRGPNVLCMCRNAPRQTKEFACIAPDRSWRVDEMNMQPIRLIGPFRCKNCGLAETAETIRRKITHQIPKEIRARPQETTLAGYLHKRSQHPQRLITQILRQIENWRLDLVMNGVAFFVCRMAH